MKKTYLSPNTTVVKVELQNMIAVSTKGLDPSKETIETQKEDAETPAMSRHSLWDDEE